MTGICGETAHHALVINARAAPAIVSGVRVVGWLPGHETLPATHLEEHAVFRAQPDRVSTPPKSLR